MKVSFYTTKDDRRVVNKSITLLSTIDCDLKDNCNILSPALIVDKNVLTSYATCNYMYISTFKRYYYTQITAMAGDMLTIEGNVDVLMTYKSGIGSITCDVLRQENNYNKYYVDALLPKRNTKNIQYLKIGDLPLQNGIYLTVTGGQ